MGDTIGPWLGSGILILIQVCWPVFDATKFLILALYLGIEDTKITMSFKSLFGALVTGLWNTHVQNFCTQSWFWRCKEHQSPFSPELGLLRMLDVPDWGLASGSWFGSGNWCLIHPILNFGFLSWFWRGKEHPCPLSPHFGIWRTLEVPDAGEVSSSWFGYGHWSLVHPCSKCWLSVLILKV